VGDFGDRRVGGGSPGLGGGGKGERAAVEDVFASLLGDQGVEGAEGPAFAGEYEDVVRGSFAETGPDATVTIYRARESANARSASVALIGTTPSAAALLEDLRTHIGMDTALRLPPGVNSGLSIHL
jgi:hypothetical protein